MQLLPMASSPDGLISARYGGGGVSDAVPARCIHWGCSVDPFSQFSGSCVQLVTIQSPPRKKKRLCRPIQK